MCQLVRFWNLVWRSSRNSWRNLSVVSERGDMECLCLMGARVYIRIVQGFQPVTQYLRNIDVSF